MYRGIGNRDFRIIALNSISIITISSYLLDTIYRFNSLKIHYENNINLIHFVHHAF